MKKITLLLFITFGLSYASFSQNKDSIKKADGIKTLFGNKKTSHGGYFSLNIGYSFIDHKDAFAAGIKLAWVLNHSLALGIGANGFGNSLYSSGENGSVAYNLNGGYGGLLIEPIVMGKSPIHISFPILLGVGGVANVKTQYWDATSPEMEVVNSSTFLVAEPAAELEMNVFKFLRLSLGVSHRFTTGVHVGKASGVLDKNSYYLSMKFGKF